MSEKQNSKNSMTFTFTQENQTRVEKAFDKYPKDHRQSVILYALDLAQRQNGGWLSMPAMEEVAKIIGISPLKVHEVASFYTMFHLNPVGTYHVQVCGTTPCMLRGAEDLIKACQKHLGVGMKEVTKDGLFSMEEVECLGACANAPLVQINDFVFEDMDEQALLSILEKCKKNELPLPFSAKGRTSAAPHHHEKNEPSSRQISSNSPKQDLKETPKQTHGEDA